MMRHVFFGLTLLLFGACAQKSDIKVAHTGAPSEVLVEAPEYLWTGKLQEQVEASFFAHYPGLPQPEYTFNLLYYKPKDIGGLLQAHRNYIRITIDTTAEQLVVRSTPNKHSRDQLYYEIKAPNKQVLNSDIGVYLPAIKAHILKKERQKIIQRNWKKNPALTAELDSAFNIEVHAPAGFQLAKKTNGFRWFKRERVRNLSGTNHDIIDGIICFQTNYTDSTQLRNDSLLATYDQFLSLIPGPSEGSHMMIEREYYLELNEISHKTQYAKEIRGLWKLNKDFMGGAFIALSIPNSQNGKVNHLLGFIYAPKFNKRDYIKELEAIVYSIGY